MCVCVRVCSLLFLSSCPRPYLQRASFDSGPCENNVPLEFGPWPDHNHTPMLAKNTPRLHHPSPIPCWTPHSWIAHRRTSQDLPLSGSALKDPPYQGPPLQTSRIPLDSTGVDRFWNISGTLRNGAERLTIALWVRCVRKKKTLLARSGDDLDDRRPPPLPPKMQS